MATAPTLAYLRSQVERRCGAWAALADVDEALAYALASLGLTPGDAGTLADADLLTLTAPQTTQILDVAEWRVLDSALNNCDAASLKAAGIMMDPKAAVAVLAMRVDRLYLRIREQYGIGLAVLSVGTLTLNISAKGDDPTPLGSGY